jgi:biotin transport system substrate-specific component
LSITLASGRPTLADRLFTRHLVTDAVLVASGTGLTAVAAQLTVPMWPVPISGQTFAVLLVGTVLGASRGALSMVLYLVLGMIGLPIFADGTSGSLFSLTSGGFIVGFIAAAAFVGWLAERQWDHAVLRTALAFVGGTVIMYAFGLPWLYSMLGALPAESLSQFFGTTDVLQATLTGGLYPFLIGDVLKAVVAALLLPITWKLVRRADDAAEAGEA